MENCVGLGFDIYVRCKKCKTNNKLSRILEKDEKKAKEVQKLMNKAKKDKESYIG